MLVRVKACAINYPDVLIIEDKYQFRPERPFAPGGEIAGIVETVGEGVEGWSEGDRMIAMLGHGGLAEMVAVPAAMALPLPEGRSFEDGSALILTYATTIHALLDRGKLKEGETLLVLGAAGGVGLAAVELGKAYGARVVARGFVGGKGAGGARRRRRRRDRLSARPVRQGGRQGACGSVQGGGRPERRRPRLRSGRRRLYRGGAARDRLGGAAARHRLSGRDPEAAAQPHLLKSCDVRGVFWGAFAARDPKANAAHVRTLFRLWEEGKIAPKVSRTWPLAEGGEAIAHMAARKAVGKLVVTME